MVGNAGRGTGYGRSYPIVITPYEPEWPRRFDEEARRIREALGSVALRVEHIGSTAVPGLAAKPVVDIQVAVGVLDPDEAYRPALEGLGYLANPRDDPDHVFFKRDVAGRRAFQIHVVTAGSDWELRHLEFRDALQADGALRRRYEALKRHLAARFPMDLAAYLVGKETLIRPVEERLRRKRPPGAADRRARARP